MSFNKGFCPRLHRQFLRMGGITGRLQLPEQPEIMGQLPKVRSAKPVSHQMGVGVQHLHRLQAGSQSLQQTPH
ncbi:hypothetical protein D3C81_1937180 [compost metagenome]